MKGSSCKSSRNAMIKCTLCGGGSGGGDGFGVDDSGGGGGV